MSRSDGRPRDANCWDDWKIIQSSEHCPLTTIRIEYEDEWTGRSGKSKRNSLEYSYRQLLEVKRFERNWLEQSANQRSWNQNEIAPSNERLEKWCVLKGSWDGSATEWLRIGQTDQKEKSS
jgi:hypothetical protein